MRSQTHSKETEANEEAMSAQTANLLRVIGAGLLVYGLTGYRGQGRLLPAGWSEDSQLLMAVGAMLLVAGFVFRRN
ncbi:MAG: hypothetical protein HYY76_06180 [Acidobacteria bacterium]|nr:hypothetical protein [Acidobacteriota bacterium]